MLAIRPRYRCAFVIRVASLPKALDRDPRHRIVPALLEGQRRRGEPVIARDDAWMDVHCLQHVVPYGTEALALSAARERRRPGHRVAGFGVPLGAGIPTKQVSRHRGP